MDNELRDIYNEQLAAKRAKLKLATAAVVIYNAFLWLCVVITVMHCGVLVSACAVPITLLGLWGKHYLSTRH